MSKIKRGKILTVTSMKGGVGKTISVLELASAFSDMKKRVLIIDLDLYNGAISFALNLDVKKTIFNLCEDIQNNRYKITSYKDYVSKYDEFIDVLAGPKDPRQAPKIDPRYLEVIFNNFLNLYDVILIDTNNILDVTKMMAFEMSDIILDVFTPTALDIKNTKNFIAICHNMNVDYLKLILNESVTPEKSAFSDFEVKSVLKKNIDFVLPEDFYIKNIDNSIVGNKLIDAIKKLKKDAPKSYNKLCNFALDLLLDEEGVELNEEN